MSDEQIIYECSSIGVAGTTPVHLRKTETGYIARCGIAIMGTTNMDEAGFIACGHDPFHPEFYDNWAEGTGETKDAAIAMLKNDTSKTADSLWQI